jgi:hypothetical protein
MANDTGQRKAKSASNALSFRMMANGQVQTASGLLIRPHQARIARHIGGEDRGKTAGRGHGSSSPPVPGYRKAHYTALHACRDDAVAGLKRR